MKLIVAGSRGATASDTHRAIESFVEDTGEVLSLLICGGAAGADTWAKQWAEEREIPVKVFLPRWDQDGRKAGMIRNADMAAEGDALVAVWDGQSKGTKNMIEQAQRLKLPVFVWRYYIRGELNG